MTQPYLQITSPGVMHGRRVAVASDKVLVGRGPASDVRLEDPAVSRTHALLLHEGDQLIVQDLGSTGGTKVNGVRITGPEPLIPGDVVCFARVEMTYVADPGEGDETIVDLERNAGAGAGAVAYDIGDQRAHSINNVARDQYNAYIRQRESFLREVAATRTKARWLVWLGLAMFLVGGGLFVSMVFGIMQIGPEQAAGTGVEDLDSVFGEEIAGLPIGLFGWAMAAVGTVLLLIGIVLHVVTTARRRRVEHEWPLQPPGYQPR